MTTYVYAANPIIAIDEVGSAMVVDEHNPRFAFGAVMFQDKESWDEFFPFWKDLLEEFPHKKGRKAPKEFWHPFVELLIEQKVFPFVTYTDWSGQSNQTKTTKYVNELNAQRRLHRLGLDREDINEKNYVWMTQLSSTIASSIVFLLERCIAIEGVELHVDKKTLKSYERDIKDKVIGMNLAGRIRQHIANLTSGKGQRLEMLAQQYEANESTVSCNYSSNHKSTDVADRLCALYRAKVKNVPEAVQAWNILANHIGNIELQLNLFNTDQLRTNR